MSRGTVLHVLRAFVDDDGGNGNPLGVFLAGGDVPAARRQAVAAALGYSETVFVDDVRTGELRIFTPAVELPLAGHPLVGTAWLLARTGHRVDALRPPAGRVPVETDGSGLTWITADPSTAPPWHLHELPSSEAVEALTEDPTGTGAGCAWAWQDHRAGTIRMRVFASALGIAEDPATGSAALLLAARVQADLRIVQGTGSVILTRMAGDGLVRVGGRCALDAQGPYDIEPSGRA
ncbi:MAG: PhzF family phenazine biosynthesis protein [Frankiaceae bacterium]